MVQELVFGGRTYFRGYDKTEWKILKGMSLFNPVISVDSTLLTTCACFRDNGHTPRIQGFLYSGVCTFGALQPTENISKNWRGTYLRGFTVSDRWEIRTSFTFIHFFETIFDILFIVTLSFIIVIKKSPGVQSAGGGRSTSKSTCVVPAWTRRILLLGSVQAYDRIKWPLTPRDVYFIGNACNGRVWKQFWCLRLSWEACGPRRHQRLLLRGRTEKVRMEMCLRMHAQSSYVQTGHPPSTLSVPDKASNEVVMFRVFAKDSPVEISVVKPRDSLPGRERGPQGQCWCCIVVIWNGVYNNKKKKGRADDHIRTISGKHILNRIAFHGESSKLMSHGSLG